MKRLNLPLMGRLDLAAATLLMGWLTASALSQSSNQGIVTDWTSRHVIFSDPGTLVDAMMKGRRAQWERIVHDPRYRMQQMRRGLPMAGQTATSTVGLPRAQQVAPVNSNAGGQTANPRRHAKQASGQNPLHADWAVPLAPGGSSGGVNEFAAPAKYSFINTSAITNADCTDFVVFPVGNISGSSTQASLVGVTNLYATCGAPTVRFAYTFHQGEVDNSPVLSLDGTQVAFVESNATGIGANNAIFHVLKLDAAGSQGNGTSFQNPAVPGTGNNATDTGTEFQLQGTGIESGIYVDYASDTAYVTDDAGFVHKYNPVFEGTPTEITTSPWPIDLSNVESSLSAPVFDGQSQHLFFVGTTGTLYCYTTGGTTCGSLLMGGSPDQVQTFVPPIVDSTRGTVFAYGNSLSVISPNVLIQASTTDLTLVSQVSVGSLSGNLSRGAFDNAYFTDPASGHLYVGGGEIGSDGVLALRRVGFDSGGTMTADVTNSLVLQTGSAAGAGVTETSHASVSATSGNNCIVSGFDTSTGSPNLILASISGTNANSFSISTTSGQNSPLLGGATVTLLFSNIAGNAEVGVWSITGFNPGTTSSFQISTSGAAGWSCGAVAFSGVASLGTVATATATSRSPSVTVTSPGPGGVVFDTLSTGGNSATVATPASGQIPRWNTTDGGNRLGAASVAPARATMSWTLTTDNLWYLVAVPLIATSAPQQADFTSLLDVFNTSDSTERLFLGVQAFGFNSGTPNCGGTTCVTSFDSTTGTFPTGASATLTYPGVTQLISDMILDNISTGGSNIYYGVNNNGVQVTQSALQ